MNTKVIHETSHQILAGTLSFPEAVRALIAAGVDYYHVDYATRRKTCHGTDGTAVTMEIAYDDLPPIAPDFDSAALKANLVDSQHHGQHYHDFSRRAVTAGVQCYFAFLRGKRVVYLGRQGGQHVEWFPGAAPQVAAA